ncbi:hypothetical protein EW093_07545 [Thiospirochaeta perfilievii]|uniref:Uncharacterized protein n=1 Tax=Thiospirochaeta perfilievii TaxID=252967 RepID=A0A5C1QAM5_9SPIO|nr:hypothetical protein [Thiospirochaeta perfilievii]QEN04561.1 hypothetical protein EW093_07545 [Thiospirochaeta perfilievii]
MTVTNIFTFEKNNNFYDISIHLQNYRAILRDLFYLKSRHKLLKKEFDRYHKELFNYHESLIKTHAGITIKKDIKLTSVEDPNMNDIKQKIHYIEAKILVLDNDFLSGYHIQNDKKNMINTFIIEIDESIPVALAGQSNLQHKNKKGRKSSFPVYLSIFPSSNKTVFIYSLKNRYKNKMDELMLSVNHPLKYLSFIESWLIYGSDTWFINESYLNSFSKIKKNKILSDLYDLNKYPTDCLEYSLFDELRVKLLKSEKNIDSKLFKIENRKLSYFTD